MAPDVAPSARDRVVVVPDTANSHNGSPADPAAAEPGADAPDTPAVHFASNVEEIAPAEPRSTNESGVAFPEVTPEELKALSKSLHGRHLQERRMNVFNFEPMSLPVSRVNSYDDSSQNSSRQPTPALAAQPSPRLGAMASPPLTPSGTDPVELSIKKSPSPLDTGRVPSINEPQLITPQATSSAEHPGHPEGRPGHVHRSASSENVRHETGSTEDDERTDKPHRRAMFSVGSGSGASTPASRDTSPSRAAASQLYSRPFTPAGDVNDPYAASKRPPQATASVRSSIDPRFIFSRKKKSSPSSSSANLTAGRPDKRNSGFFGGLKENSDELTPNPTNSSSDPAKKGSMADLKRFFKGSQHKPKRPESPSQLPGTKTPPSSRSTQRVPFGEDHGLTSKYGKFGKVLGSGAGGSVRLMKRAEDNTVFAVKEFRPRHSYETEKEYVKKLTAEFCVGSTLHHGNIIETLDIVQEKGKWYEVMEYAPFDLFAIVMTGRMSREEVRCCFLQILNGVTYLHSMGLAHRDLKLDNVVVTAPGIMKIIDFGSAHVFKYPFESSIVPASGIVGSDPYLAPEVYDERKYDPQAVDIWSLAIIFCCMSLRRFPWKVPRMTDSSFRLFAAEPTPGHDPKKLIHPSRSTNDLTNTPARDIFPPEEEDEGKKHHHHHEKEDANKGAEPRKSTDGTEKKEVIRGPWRILRLLPRESRHILRRMLEIKPKDRAKMSEILEEPWVADTVICQQTEFGKIVVADDHTHVLEPPTAAPAAGPQK